ncbi:tetratricopeptide repeat protein [Xanthobacter sp. V0B-10]|uniref:bacteriophage N4 adsorption protein A n=1 Tax=Xanthobacter albus TaxID=3119929 RepID=UPI00372B83D7
MMTAIQSPLVHLPALRREGTPLPHRLARGLMLAASVSALALGAVGAAQAQPGGQPVVGAPTPAAPTPAPATAAPGAVNPVPAPQAQAPAAVPPAADGMEPVAPALTGAAWNTANQAYQAFQQKNFARAAYLAREVLRLRPDAPQMWVLLMDSLDAEGKLAESVAAGNEAIAAGVKDQALRARLIAQSKMLAQAPSLAANKALEANDPAKAVDEARKAIMLVPDDLSYRMLLVYALIAQKNYEAAEKAASDAVEVDPRSFLPRTLRGFLRVRLGHVAEAERDFDEALKDEVLTGDTERDVRVIMADAALSVGHVDRALKLLEPLADSGDKAVLSRLSVARAAQKNPRIIPDKANQTLPVPYQKCMDTPYGPACALVPADAPPGSGVTDTPGFYAAQDAFEAYRNGDDATAEKRIREALQLNPKNAAWHRLLIDTLERAGKLKELEAAINDAVAKAGEDPSLQALRAVTDKRIAEPDATQAIKELTAGRPKNAAALARKAVERAPNVMPFRLILINALMASGQTQDAQIEAAAAVAEDENDPLPRLLNAWLLDKLDRRPEAVSEFDKVLASNILTDVEEANFRLIAANAALAAGQGEEALKILQPLDDAKNKDVTAYRRTAEALAKTPNMKRPALVAPTVLCQPTKYGVICSVFFGAPGGPGGAGLNPASPGYAAASAAYTAFGRRDYATAVREIRKAIDAEPGNNSYRMLLMNALMASGRYAEAERILDQLLAASPRDAALLVQRGNLRMQARQYAAAIRDFRAALASGQLPAAQARTVRLALVDAALQAKDPELALSMLQSMAGDQSYDVQARLGYTYLALGEKEAALSAFEAAARRAQGLEQRNAMLTARVNLLVQLGRKEEAQALFAAAYERGDLKNMRTVDLAVLASQAGEDELAFQYFKQANDKWQLRGTNLINAAYNARRTYNNTVAVDYFKRAIDENRKGDLPLDPQYLFGLRREVAELSRTWGAYASISYGAVGIAPGSYLASPSQGASHTLGGGGEIYWRPPGIGYRDGALFELFVRGFTTLYDENGGPTGFDTFQGSVGARWKPFKTENLVLEVSYLFPTGGTSRQDVLLRAAYSKGEGTDLRVDEPNWRAWQIYADVNYYTMLPETIASFEARYGHAFRLDSINDHMVLWPFLAIGGAYDNGYATPFALGVGPGVSLRYWFNEDEYQAPHSYVDLVAQYRFKLAGDDRAEGLFAGAFLSY